MSRLRPRHFPIEEEEAVAQLRSIHARLERVSRHAAILGGLGIIFISFMITVDVLLRKFAGTTLGGATEIAGMIFGVATAIAYPYVLLDRANIRIDVLYTMLKPPVRAMLDILALVSVLYFAARLTQSTYSLLEKSWNAGTKSVGVVNIPLWIPQSLWVLGFVLLTLTAVFLLVFALIAALRRDWRSVGMVAGVPSIEETIEEETHIEHEADHASANEEPR